MRVILAHSDPGIRSTWKPGTTWLPVSTGRKCSQTVTTKKPKPRYASTRKPDVRSSAIHYSASSNTRCVVDCAPCPWVGPRRRNPRHGKGVNSWLSPIPISLGAIRDILPISWLWGIDCQGYSRSGQPSSRGKAGLVADFALINLETAVELISRKDAKTQSKRGRTGVKGEG